ncbi:MAG: TIGR02281 family clan AA aspartic protease [Allosphingosinicella sp.]
MSGGENQALSLIYLAGVLVLVVSALAVRRVPMRQGLKMAAAWILIFAAVFAIFALKDDFAALGGRLADAVRGTDRVVVAGESVRIRMDEDGHFWVDGTLNGEAVRFLVDSGATVTSLSAAAARKAGVEPDGGFSVMVNTANGTIAVERGRAGRLQIGTIVREDLPVHISKAFGDTNVLGMNFLSSLSRWEVEGEWLVLTP